MSAREQWTARFEAFVQDRTEPDWMTALRRRAWEFFLENGLPTRKNERWKYTSLRRFARQEFVTPQPEPTDIAFENDGIDAIATLSHINGRTQLGGSDLGKLKPEIAIRPLREAWDDAKEALERRCDALRDGYEALQLAFAADGALIFIGNDVQMDAPIRLVRRTTTENAFAPVFDMIVVGRHAEAKIYERYEGSASQASSGGICDVTVKEGGHLEHVIVQEEPDTVWHVRSVESSVKRDGHYRVFTLATGGYIGRHEHHVEFADEGVESELNGLTLARGNQTIDHCTLLNHAKPEGTSRQRHRAIVDDHAHSVFYGEVVIARDAQHSDSDQLNNNLLLSENARADTRPQLVIGADDVKANHGATLGQLDETELFYLTSRAISPQQAQKMLIAGFAQEVVETIKAPELRALATARVHDWLEQSDLA